MKIYLTMKSIPELRGKPKALRMAAWRACFWKAFTHWQTWVAGIGLITVLAVTPFPMVFLARLAGEKYYDFVFCLIACLVGFGGWFLFFEMITWQMRPHLKKFVEEH